VILGGRRMINSYKYTKDLTGYGELMEKLLSELEDLKDIPVDFLYDMDSETGINWSDDDDLYDDADDIKSAIHHCYNLVYAFVNKIRRRARNG
jgi:hypothetical protein